VTVVPTTSAERDRVLVRVRSERIERPLYVKAPVIVLPRSYCRARAGALEEDLDLVLDEVDALEWQLINQVGASRCATARCE